MLTNKLINSFIFINDFILNRVLVNPALTPRALDVIPYWISWDCEYFECMNTPWWPSHNYKQISVDKPPTGIFLDTGQKPDNPEETNVYIGRTCKTLQQQPELRTGLE